jgi:hypothetical protein
MQIIVARSNWLIPSKENLGVSSTENYGFTPLWALQRHFYGFDADKDVRAALSKIPTSGVTVLENLSPKLFIVEQTKDPQRLKELALALVQTADEYSVEHLLVCSFVDLRSKLDLSIIESIFKGFLSYCNAQNIEAVTVQFSSNENYHKARAVLSRIKYDSIQEKYKSDDADVF